MVLSNTLMRSDLDLPGVAEVYHGKVRDVYHLKDGRTILVATDRISAFDVVLPRGIPHKGQVLSQLSWNMLQATAHIAPNWAIASPDPNVVVGHRCATVKVEMVVRGYLVGHAWRTYQQGERMLCGAEMPEGLKENDAFPAPLITPSTKADEGHDEEPPDVFRDAPHRLQHHGARLLGSEELGKSSRVGSTPVGDGTAVGHRGAQTARGARKRAEPQNLAAAKH